MSTLKLLDGLDLSGAQFLPALIRLLTFLASPVSAESILTVTNLDPSAQFTTGMPSGLRTAEMTV